MNKDIIERTQCPVCHSNSYKSLFNRSFNEKLIKEYMNVAYQGNADISFLKNVQFEIVKCKNCNLSYQKYILTDDKLDELYNKWIDPDLALDWNEENKNQSDKTYRFILDFALRNSNKPSSEIKILDYGAGFGDSLILAKQMGFDAYAYEYSTERIKSLESKGIKIINRENKILFDIIIVNQVLEHVTYPDEILKFIRSLLNKKGILYVAVPNCPDMIRKTKRANLITDAVQLHQALLDAGVGAFQHINFFTNSNLKKLVKYNGFRLISPFRQIPVKSISIKYVLRPFYRHYFSTGFLLVKSGD